MNKKSEKYGIYFGELIGPSNLSEDFYYGEDYTAAEVVNRLNAHNLSEIVFDVENDRDNYADTLFFEVNENTDMVGLMVSIVNMRPHEFEQTSENCFRMWFD